ncbi:helix-turn-helix domain-containing protein [Streptomyces gamaensis]|uniref:Helix-turn-helix domain-containing protein n=1 Tax=Streptomyces gamaensis TaxID=1763542 RepID=A0ABW0ZAP4_9ACTN
MDARQPRACESADPASGPGAADAATRLRTLRQQCGVSLNEPARMTFGTKGYLSKVENGEKPPTRQHLHSSP